MSQKKKKRKYHTLIKKRVVILKTDRQKCAQNLVTGCESKNMMECAVHRSDYGSIHYCNGHYGNEFNTVMGTNAVFLEGF